MTSLSSLFVNSLFRIPDYQRGFAWNTSQLDDFWDDLYNLPDGRYHYTGMLSLKELDPVKDCQKWDEDKWIIENGYKAFHVVDGQQRLTTIIILLNSILDFAAENDIYYLKGKSIEDIREKYIVEYNKPLKISKSYKFGYENGNPSFKFLRYIILGESYSEDIEESCYTLNLKRAKDYFDEKLSKNFVDDKISKLESLYTKLVNRLQFNIHEIDNDFDVYVAFETMNNRGKKLSNLEILKNRLIYLTTIFPDVVLSVNDKLQLRNNINNAWREVYKQLGNNKNKPLDDDEYLRNHWTLFYKYTRNKGDDYIKFLLNKQFTPKAVYGEQVDFDFKTSVGEIDDEDMDANLLITKENEKLVPKDINDYVNSLKEISRFWSMSYNPENSNLSDIEKKWLNRLNRIGINYFRTLIVASLINNEVTTDERVELFKTVEKFIFLCFRLGKYNSNYESVSSYKFARDLYFKKIKIAKIIEYFQNGFNKNITGALDAFKSDMVQLFTNYDGFYSWYPRWYFLFEYEASLSEKRNIEKLNDWSSFTKSDKDKISIEHIFPQKPTAWYWRNAFRKYDNENERHRLANSLGNLLALSQSINSSLQNDEFELKKTPKEGRSGYKKGSFSEQEVADEKYWTPTEILNRGLHLLSFMEKRWSFKFPSDEFKISVLGLDFMKEERPDVPEIEVVDYTYRDTYFGNEVNEIRVSEYLADKDMYMVKYYDKIFKSLCEKIPNLYETARKNYIAIRSQNLSKHIVEVHIQNSKRKICFQTRALNDALIASGEVLPNNYLWALNYRIYLSECADYREFVDYVFKVYQEMLKNNRKENADKDVEMLVQIQKSNNIFNHLKSIAVNKNIEILTHGKRYIRFVSKKIRDVVGRVGDGCWAGIKDLLVYEVNNTENACVLSLYIGPGSKEDRSKWLAFAKQNPIFNVGRDGNKWTSIYNLTLQNTFDEDVGYIERLNDFFDNEFIHIDNLF